MCFALGGHDVKTPSPLPGNEQKSLLSNGGRPAPARGRNFKDFQPGVCPGPQNPVRSEQPTANAAQRRVTERPDDLAHRVMCIFRKSSIFNVWAAPVAPKTRSNVRGGAYIRARQGRPDSTKHKQTPLTYPVGSTGCVRRQPRGNKFVIQKSV